MDLFLQQLSNGLVVGSTYAVVAVGFALAFTVLRVIQFAHPDVFMIGMFSGMMAAGIVPGGGLAVALIGGAVGSTAIGAVIERMHGVRFSQTQVWRILGSLGFSPQKPEKQAIERNEDAVRSWKRRTWPALKKKPSEKAD